jgi:HEAT repeat protein
MTVFFLIALQTVLIAGNCLVNCSGQDFERLNLFSQSQGSSDAAMKAFSAARNLIKDGDWAKAEQSFTRFIADYPQDKDVVAATYWLAFALKQQSKFRDADNTLTQLIEKFPGSSWVTDARAMQVEIAPRLNKSKDIAQGVKDDNEEIRLAALQSLFEAKPERGVAMAAEILKPGSGESRLMKEGAIALLTDCETKQAVAVLIDTVRNETDYELRKKAVRALGEHDDESVLEPLKGLVTQYTDKEIARIAVQALAEHNDLRAQALLVEIARSNAEIELRAEAVRGLGEREHYSVVDELLKLFASDKNRTIREEIISTLGEVNHPRAADGLIQLYDAEKDENIKEIILDALGESEEKNALRKLIDVVRREPSLKLKKKALAMIGESEDLEALQFLEELLKKN